MRLLGISSIIVAALLGVMAFTAPEPEAAEAAESLTWHTDFMEAHKLSEAEGKPIFAFFTGSDWCGWCIKLQNAVFKKQKFIDWANENVILLELDFPRKKQLPVEQQQQNHQIRQALKVTGYPTVWIITATVNPEANNINLNSFGRLGYPSGATPGKEEDKFIENADLIMAKYNNSGTEESQ